MENKVHTQKKIINNYIKSTSIYGSRNRPIFILLWAQRICVEISEYRRGLRELGGYTAPPSGLAGSDHSQLIFP